MIVTPIGRISLAGFTNVLNVAYMINLTIMLSEPLLLQLMVIIDYQ